MLPLALAFALGSAAQCVPSPSPGGLGSVVASPVYAQRSYGACAPRRVSRRVSRQCVPVASVATYPYPVQAYYPAPIVAPSPQSPSEPGLLGKHGPRHHSPPMPVEPPSPSPEPILPTPPAPSKVVPSPQAGLTPVPAFAVIATDPYAFGVWLNAYRASCGLPALAYDANLAADCVRNSQIGFGHFWNGRNRMTNAGWGPLAGVCQMWVADPPHRATLLDPAATCYGIGANGQVWTFGIN